jgi:hypothetical protein
MASSVAVAGGDVAVLVDGRYRVGGEWTQIPDWRFRTTRDVGLAAHDGRFVVLAVTGRAAYYRTGPEWDPWVQIAGWRGASGDVAVAGGELIVVGEGRYRVGWGADRPWLTIPDWQPGDGVAADAADLDGDGRAELLVRSGAQLAVGWGLDEEGRAADGWGPWTEHPGVGAAIASSRRLVTLDADGNHRSDPLALDIDKAASKGVWRILGFDSEIIAVHAALLHTGDVLFFAGSGNRASNFNAHRFRTRLWRYPSAHLTAPHTPIDLFCCGHAVLPGGRLLAAGGTRRYKPFRGIRDALVFDPPRRRWLRARKMGRPRWYPSLITLGFGNVLAVSGRGDTNALERVPELFTHGAGWTPLAVRGVLPFYPQLTLLDDGRIFYSGGRMGAARGARPEIWNLATGQTTPVPGLARPAMRNQSATVLLPPAQRQRVMIAGGGGEMMHDHEMKKPQVATRSAAIADLSVAAPRYKATGKLKHARMHLNLVLLPDRTVLASGGAAVAEHAVNAALEAEIFHPATGRWRTAAKARVPRMYHSVALLTPDGKVITAGSNPRTGVEELRIEVFSPPYLFKGARPTLKLARDHAGYGEKLRATTHAAHLREVNLVRPSATTHSSNSEQRLLDLPFTVKGPNSVELTLPSNPNLAPPGWYMVFAVSTGGVPSMARWLHLPSE